MDYSSYGDGQGHPQANADSSQAYQQQHDYYYQQYQTHPSYHQPASAYYYPPGYNSAVAAASDAQPAASYFQQQPHADTALHPPGIDHSNLAQVTAAAAAATNQQNGYFPQAITHQHGHPMPPFPHLMAAPADPGRVGPGGFRESHWAGKRGGGFGPPRGASRVRGPPFRGGGRRGGGNFARGGGRGNFNPHMPRFDIGLPPHARGRGRIGKGGARRPASGAPAQLVGCAVCKIDCNSLEILEQHRQGKRHLRNVQRLEEEQRREKLGNVSETKTPSKTKDAVENQQNEVPESENLPDFSQNTENKTRADQHEVNHEQQTKDAEQTDADEQQQQPKRHPDWRFRGGYMRRGRGRGRGSLGSYEDRRMGPNKRLQGRSQFDPRKGKRARMSNVPPPPIDPQQMPKICALCNITCDSQAVLDCHLAGKRHAAKVKRFQSQQQLYGPQVLQSLFLSQAQQAISTLTQQQAVFNPQDQQALLEALLSQAIQQVIAGQAGAATQDQSALPGVIAVPAAASEPQVQEHGAGNKEAASKSEEDELEGCEQVQDGDAQEEEGDDEDEEGDEQEQSGDAQEEDDDKVEGGREPEQGGDAQGEGDDKVEGGVEPKPGGDDKEDEEPQVQEHGAGNEEAASESEEDELEGCEQVQDGDAQEEEGDDEDEEGDEQEQSGDVQEEDDDKVEGGVEPKLGGDAQEEGDKKDDEQDQDGTGVSTENGLPVAQDAISTAEHNTLAPGHGASAAENVVPGLEIKPEETKQTEDAEN